MLRPKQFYMAHFRKKSDLSLSWLSLSTGTCLAYGSVHQSHWRTFTTNRNLQFEVHWRRKMYSMQTVQSWHSTAVNTAWLWNSSIMIQHGCETGLPFRSPGPGFSPTGQQRSAPRWFSVLPFLPTRSARHWSAPLCSRETSLVFQPRKHSLWWEGKVSSQSKRGALIVSSLRK